MSGILANYQNESMPIDHSYLVYALQKTESILDYTHSVIAGGGTRATQSAREKLTELGGVIDFARKTASEAENISEIPPDGILNFFVALSYIARECFSILSPGALDPFARDIPDVA